MIVSEAHRQLVEEANRLVERLGLSKWMATDVVPSGDLYLRLLPALHTIVDRLEKLEAVKEEGDDKRAAQLNRLEKAMKPYEEMAVASANLAAEEESRV